MPVTTVSSREFNQRVSRAKKAARKGPVFITDRGTPSLVLLDINEYNKITGKRKSMADLLSCPEAADIEFDPPRLDLIARAVDFS